MRRGSWSSRVLPVLAATAIVVLVAWSFWTALAGANTTITTPGDPDLGRWVSSVVAHSLEPLPDGAYVVSMDATATIAGAHAGGYYGSGHVVLAERDSSALMHELGHAYDDAELVDGQRAHLKGVLGVDQSTPWQNPARWTSGDPFCQWAVTCPNELFANAYAGCALGTPLMSSHSTAVAPGARAWAWWIGRGRFLTVAHLKQLCRYIGQASAARRDGAYAPARPCQAPMVIAAPDVREMVSQSLLNDARGSYA